jgi:hypothetical protein
MLTYADVCYRGALPLQRKPLPHLEVNEERRRGDADKTVELDRRNLSRSTVCGLELLVYAALTY